MKNLKYLLIYLTSIISIGCDAQSDFKKLDNGLSKIQKDSKMPGFAVVIIKYDSVVFSKGYGFADIKSKSPYTPETIQPIGSVSKTFIGLALIKAVEQRYFTLETNINDILPFKVFNPNFPNTPIQIKHLATHTSGLLDNDSTYLNTYVLGKKPTVTLKDLLKDYFSSDGKMYSKANFATTESGKTFNYSNLASSLAAYIIEVKTNTSFEKYTQKNIFEPLKMNDTHWFYDDSKAKKYATLYEVNKQSNPLYNQILNTDGSLKIYSCNSYPDGSLKSSASDLTKYMIAMMKGYFDTSDLLNKQNFNTLFQKKFSEKNMPTNMPEKEPNRAIFWVYNRKEKLIHTGGDAGVSTFVSFDPKTKIGRVILINTQLDGDDDKEIKTYAQKMFTHLDEFESTLK